MSRSYFERAMARAFLDGMATGMVVAALVGVAVWAIWGAR